ncbi:arylsulfatase [Nibrella viscosa]|uniref:Arylsulfatase n=1 Tax=Nibrella viscosa TaxID=1084524 RepID=A0ABP8KSE5_9BACT
MKALLKIGIYLVLTIGGLYAASAQSGPRRKPNIIYILADDLGYGDLACYGQKVIQTPNLDRMAREGMRFTQHYAGSTVCAPSRSALMTGLHTGHTRIRGNARFPLLPEDKTVAEYLKEAGYTTALIGKWGLGEDGSSGVPRKQGFDYFYGYLNQTHAHNHFPDFLWRNEEKVRLANEVVYAESGGVKGIGSAATKRVEWTQDLFTKEALQFIEQSKQSPFFLYLSYVAPHANNEHRLASPHGMEVPDYGPYANRDFSDVQKGLAASITKLDADVGSLLAKLNELKLDENTLVIFTSDNGPHAEGGNDPAYFNSSGGLRGIKRDLYEGGIRVPMITRWPGKIKAGAVTSHPSAFWDFLPTACALAGIQPSTQIDGISYLPTLLGKGTQKQHPYLYWEFHEQGRKQAVRQGNYKLISLLKDNQWELYDLSRDPAEQQNIAAQHPAVVSRLKSIMTEARVPSEEFPFTQ